MNDCLQALFVRHPFIAALLFPELFVVWCIWIKSMGLLMAGLCIWAMVAGVRFVLRS